MTMEKVALNFPNFMMLLFLSSIVISCSDDERDSLSLLTGTWNLKTEVGYTQETLTFHPNGSYEIIDYANFLGTFGNSTVEKARLKGNFQFDDATITFLTAEVDFYEDAELDKTLLTTTGSTIGSFYGYDQVGVFADTNYVVRSILLNDVYNPVTWEVIELSEGILKVKKGVNFFEYERN